ncbi:MAG: hypothetical protein IJY83_05625 [Oscillospiraceae bacterium]|nr:hypothetical protein [Oscillospiraceae bacterium]
MDKFNNADREKLFENNFLDFSSENIRANYPDHISTGFDKLDSLLGGGLAPGLTILGAVSSLGKSTLSLQLAQNIAKQGIYAIYYSLEMPKHAIAMKAVQRSAFKKCKKNAVGLYEETENSDKMKFSSDVYREIKKQALSSTDILNNDIKKEKEDLRKFAEEECKKECKNRLIVLERDLKNDSFSAEDIAGDVEWFIEKKGEKPVVFVDYLQILVSSKEKALQEKQIVDENIQKLWLVANQNQIPVFVISSVNRDSYNKPISFSAFKESGGIEFTADVVLGMQLSAVSDGIKDVNLDKEKGKDPRRVEVIVLKQRYGKSGFSANDRFIYYPEYSYFEEGDIINTESSDENKNAKNVKNKSPETPPKSENKNGIEEEAELV